MTAVTAGSHGHTRAGRRDQLVAGARAMAPWLVGIVPYGIVIGITAAQAGISTLAGWLSGPLVFSGSAQVITIQLLDDGAAPLVVVAAALAVNLRLVLYSATMARYWTGEPRWVQALGAYVITDPVVAVGVDGYERAPDRTGGHLHYLGGAGALWLAWIGAITAGATVCSGVPAGWQLGFVAPLFLAGEVVPRLSSRATRRGVGAALGLVLLGDLVPYRLGTVVAILGGIVVALGTKEIDR
jgi:predicted branched-subunit amino acid permease